MLFIKTSALNKLSLSQVWRTRTQEECTVETKASAQFEVEGNSVHARTEGDEAESTMWLLLPQVPVPRTPPPPEPGTHTKEGPALGMHDTLAESTAGRVTTKGTFVTVPRPPVEHVGHSLAHPTVLGALRACEGIARPLQFTPLHFHSFSLWEKEKSLCLPLKPIASLSALKTFLLQNWSFQDIWPLDWKFGNLFPSSLFQPMESRGCRGRLEGPHGCTHPSSGIIRRSPCGGGRLLLLS